MPCTVIDTSRAGRCCPFALRRRRFRRYTDDGPLVSSERPGQTTPIERESSVLRTGGLLFVNVPAYQWLYSSHDAAIHTVHRFTRKEVTRLIEAAGFLVLRARYWNTFLFPPIAALRIWRKIRSRDQSDTSDYANGIVGTVFESVLTLERRVARAVSIPLGLSIFVVAQKRP